MKKGSCPQKQPQLGRLLARPWRADHVLNTLATQTITGSESVCQKVWHSTVLSAWFAEAVQSSSLKAGQSLSAAQHRFASFSKPLGRMILHLPEFFKVLNKVVSTGSNRAWAENWLLNVTGERLLLLGMMADAADTTEQLTRFCDSEEMDLGRLNEEVALFMRRCEVPKPRPKCFFPCTTICNTKPR